jgi:hypothetical protein
MIRHVVVLTFNDDVTADQRTAFEQALRELPGRIPEILDYQVGSDAGLAETNHQFAIVADFADVDDYLVYRDHPAHTEFKQNHLAPLVAQRGAVQYEW